MTEIKGKVCLDSGFVPFLQQHTKCLICNCPLYQFNCRRFDQNQTLGHFLQKEDIDINSCSDSSSKPESNGNANAAVGKQLNVIFILKHLLELSENQLEKYLRHGGDPEHWIRLCDKCNESVEKAKRIYKELQTLTLQFEEVKWEMQEKISATFEDGFKNAVKGPVAKTKMRRNGKRGPIPTMLKFQVPMTGKEFDIVESCREIVCSRGMKPPPLTMCSNPFIKGDARAHQLVGDRVAPFKLPKVETSTSDLNAMPPPPPPPPRNKMKARPEPEREMATLVKYEPVSMVEETSDLEDESQLMEEEEEEEDEHDAEDLNESEPDFGYIGDTIFNEKQTNKIKMELFTETEEEEEGNNSAELENMEIDDSFSGDPIAITETDDNLAGFKETYVPCPLCTTHKLNFSHMGESCRHLLSCLSSYSGRLRFLTCGICKKFKCRVGDIRSYGEHLNVCRDGLGSETLPLEQKIFSCSLCKYAPEYLYMDFHEFLKHLYKFHQHEYSCTQCPMRFETLQDCSMQHWTTKHKPSVSQVTTLQRFHMTPPELPEIPWLCPLCFKNFPGEIARDTHLEKCPELEDQFQPDRSFKCEVKSCSKSFFWEEEIKIHEVTVHAKIPTRESKSKQNQNRKKGYFCEHCSKYYTTKERLESHSVTLSLSRWLYNTAQKCHLVN